MSPQKSQPADISKMQRPLQNRATQFSTQLHLHLPKQKKTSTVIERPALSFLYWPQWDNHQLLVSLSYAQQQL